MYDIGKQLSAAFQSVVSDEPGSDCGTKEYITIEITNKNKKDYKYRYIVEGNSLVCLYPDIIDKYVGKMVKMRSPMFCHSQKYCSKCLGEYYYQLGIRNIGLTTNRVGSTLLNLSLKSMHSNVISSTIINIDDYLV